MDQFLNIRVVDKDTGVAKNYAIGDKATADQAASNKLSITQINNDIDEMKQTDDALTKAVKKLDDNYDDFTKDISRRVTIAEENIQTHSRQIDDLTAQTFLITQASNNIGGLVNTSFRSGKILFLSGEFRILADLKAGTQILRLGKTATKAKTVYFRCGNEWLPFSVGTNATISAAEDIDAASHTEPVVFDCVVGRTE